MRLSNACLALFLFAAYGCAASDGGGTTGDDQNITDSPGPQGGQSADGTQPGRDGAEAEAPSVSAGLKGLPGFSARLQLAPNGDIKVSGMLVGTDFELVEFGSLKFRVVESAKVEPGPRPNTTKYSVTYPRAKLLRPEEGLDVRYSLKDGTTVEGSLDFAIEDQTIKGLSLTLSNGKGELGYGTSTYLLNLSGALPITKGGGAPTGDLELHGEYSSPGQGIVSVLLERPNVPAFMSERFEAKLSAAKDAFDVKIPKDKLAGIGVTGGGKDGLSAKVSVAIRFDNGTHRAIVDYGAFSIDDEKAGLLRPRFMTVSEE